MHLHLKVETTVAEISYPLNFRQDDASTLSSHVTNRHSVELIGMKRVGIGNFLRFFLYHKGVHQKYLNNFQSHLFIPVDLNDLVEREIFPFWMLTLKRIVDTIEKSSLDKSIKLKVSKLFLECIQSKDLFHLIDCIRSSLITIVEKGFLPTIFFIRFDRIKSAATAEFFNNFEGLHDATHQKLVFVFTTYRSLNSLSPEIFNHAPLSIFSQNLYLKPVTKEDFNIVLKEKTKYYKLKLSSLTQQALFELVGGHIQYLYLSLIALFENGIDVKNKEELFNLLVNDERITLQSEELWESLNSKEQKILIKISKKQNLDASDLEDKYLFETGFIKKKDQENVIFSPLLQFFIEQKTKKQGNGNFDLSKKENLLFAFLKENIEKICEREAIIEAVWPEEEEVGVSDWAIDRLVARLRYKLKLQKSELEIVTVKTRGYKLVET